MPRICVVLLACLAALSLFAAPNPAPVNLDFESGSEGEVPPGWFSPTTQFGYTAALTTDRPQQGKQSVKLTGAPAPDARMAFGNVMQHVDAAAYRGKRVRLRGAVRVEGVGASAGLWLRVDRAQKQMGFFDNMQDRPIRSSAWAYYEIAGDVAADAESLNLGLILQGTGTAWLDDVTIDVVPNVPARSAPPRALTPRGLENLVAFTRLFGIVRHFHPSDEAAAADWDAIAVDGPGVVEHAKDANELAARLGDVFLPIAPSIRIVPTSAKPKGLPKPDGAQEVVAWQHHGFGHKQSPQGPYASERIRRKLDEPDARFPDPLQPFLLDLGAGVSASVPLSVFADGTATLPRPTRDPPPHPNPSYTGNDRATRIGAVVLVWNVVQHFYPYFDVVKVDWAAELTKALCDAATDRDEAAFLRTLRRMIAALDDGHGSVTLMAQPQNATLPLRWRAIGDALVVTAVDPAASEVRVGDEVVAIDGRAVPDALREVEAMVSASTPQWRRWTAQNQLASGAAGTNVALTIRNADGSTRTATLARAVRPAPLADPRPEKIAELKPGLWYVDLSRISDADFTASLEKLAAAKGIVFDLRGYPRGIGTKPLQHMIDSVAESARWNVPILHRPNFEGVSWSTRGRWSLDPQQPRLTKHLAFLTDGRAISYAESWMGIIEAYKLAEIVGETTAGTNGNVNIHQLPGGYRVIFTGMKVLKHDGSRHHGVGIAPTVPVSPTLAGIRAGRDEQLEKAIEVLEKR